eukprot:gene167-95_t
MRTSTHRASHRAPPCSMAPLRPRRRPRRGMARCRYNSRPYAHGKGRPRGDRAKGRVPAAAPRHTHTSLHTGCMRRESAGGRVEHRAIRQGKGCFQAYWGDNTLYHKDSKLGRQCVISRVVITTMLFESIIICRCCTPAPVWRAGGVAGADGLIRASTRLERTQDMHNGHCAWRSVRCARVRTEHHTARPLFYGPYVRGAGHAEAWRGAATTRGRTPTGKGALEVTEPGSVPAAAPAHTHISTHGMHAAGERWRACGTPRDQTGQRQVSHTQPFLTGRWDTHTLRTRCAAAAAASDWGDNTLYHKDSKSLREPGEGLTEESYHHTPCRRVRRAARRQTGATMRNITGGHYYNRQMRTSTHRASHRAPPCSMAPLRPRRRPRRGMARCRYNSRPYAHGKGALEVTGAKGPVPAAAPATHTHISTRDACGGRALAGVWNTARSDRAK